MVDMVVHRHQLRGTLANLCRLLTKAPLRPPEEQLPVPAEA
jgi:acetyl-CoA carboxylase carboxyl transferase subunit beta